MKSKMAPLLLTWLIILATARAEEPVSPNEPPPAPIDQSSGVDIPEVNITGNIDGNKLAVTLEFEAETESPDRRILLIQGDAVLQRLNSIKPLSEPDYDRRRRPEYRLDYEPDKKAYYVSWPRTGRHKFQATFAVRPKTDPENPWRRANLQIPYGRVRRIRLVSSRPDLEVRLPGAMRIKRKVENSQLEITAILGPQQELVVQWKPRLKLVDAKLVLSSRANTIVDVRAGLLHYDALFDFQIAQGRIEKLELLIPTGLSITALDGDNIRNWMILDPNNGPRNLLVELSTPQEKDYRLRIRAEAGLDKLPAQAQVPVIEPTGGIRASGHLAVGTDSALQLVVLESKGLTQIDAAVFPRIQATAKQDRPIPKTKAFFYTYAGSGYQLKLSVDDVVPTYDVAGRFVATIKEDDLVLDAELELDVRDAPIRELEIIVPAGMVVASVDGDRVEDYHVSQTQNLTSSKTVRTVFSEPVIGRVLVQMRLELGRGPLGQQQTIPALQVTDAKTHRGYLVVAAEAGIEIDDPEGRNLREVHTASVPLRVPLAQFAYRFRRPDWNLTVMARSKPAEVRAEVFHLQSVGEALAYGSAVVNYIITGSPADELRFSLPDTVENVEFIGSDVSRWTKKDDLWVVTLGRKVIGDYSLAMTYTQRYGPDKPIYLGAMKCTDVQTQTGYVVVTSHLDLKLRLQPVDNADANGLLEIPTDELPADYRLLTSSPILSTYKYVTEPHMAMLGIDPYRRSGLLPVVLDIVANRTNLDVKPQGQVQSVTTIRYKVKNTTGQFLSLAMPKGARVWSVFLIERKGTGEQQTRLATSHDTESGRLLIPLSRKANPNAPSTIQLEYGQVHETSGWWRRQLSVTTPRCAVPANYAEWIVTAPDEWAINATEGNIQPQPRRMARVGIPRVLDQIARLWTTSFQKWIEQPVVWAICIAALVLVVLCIIFSRRWLPDLLVVILLALLIWIGAGAAMSGQMKEPAPATSLRYAQAVNADPDGMLLIRAELVPAWRRCITKTDIIAVFAILSVALAGIIIKRRLWWPPLAAILTALLYLATKVPPTWPAMKVIMTWGAPAAMAAWCILRAWVAHRRRLSVAARAMALPMILTMAVISLSAGCVGTGAPIDAMAERSMVETIECNMTADADNIEVRYKLRIAADEPASFPLLDESAVLVSEHEPAPHVTVQLENGRHAIVVDRANVYDVEATFLVPLPPADHEHRRCFSVPMPMALINSVNLVIPDANVIVDAPQAVRLVRRGEQNKTIVETVFAPGRDAVFTWRPKERQADQEEKRFYASDVALAHVSSGLIQVFHAVRLQIAQGQIDTLKMRIAAGQTVTSVNAPQIGSWRFDPATHQLDLRLTQPVTGVYEVVLVTQAASASLPYTLRLEPLVVLDALSQHSMMALAADPSVYFRMDNQPVSMNVRDYMRDADKLIKRISALTPEHITHAFRFDSTDSAVTARVFPVKSELRSRETARFNAEDDRLIYNSQWAIDIAKAGRFDIVLNIPEGFDIDALAAEQISHWDESEETAERSVRVHFKRKLVGAIQLNLALSRPLAQMPDRLTVPRVTLEGVIKHTGHLLVGSEQGVRLSIASRQGVSEIDPAEIGQPGTGLLAFRMLRPDWTLELQTELIRPRITVDTLHVAKVTDGLVRHDHYLRYKLFNAGTKTFEMALPQDATGVTITGHGIARREQLGKGTWRVELDDKVYDRPYLLVVNYETQYDRTAGDVSLAPIRCLDIDLQQGHTVVFATDRVELSVDSTDASLRPAEARSIPKYFGAGDLSGAAMCYRTVSTEHILAVKARRHTPAKQIGADVRLTEIHTVVTPTGQTIHRVALMLRVGDRRHLQTVLPENGEIWSLSVDGEAVQPSIRTKASGREVLLVPLPQQTADDVLVEMVYVARLPSVPLGGGIDDWAGVHRLSGPQFDLPLKQITWYVYVPEGFSYDKFGGTLTIDKKAATDQQVLRYNLRAYEEQLVRANSKNDEFAQKQQKLARELAEQGRQADARRALAIGYNFSRNNKALNEDIRVDLDNLLRQQAKVGLVSARGRLRQQASGTIADGAELIEVSGKDISFSRQQADRIESSLAKEESDNLELITRRIIQAQEAATGSVAQLQITMPFSGKMLRFDSSLQAEPDEAMMVMFRAQQQKLRRLDPSIWYALGLLALLLALGGAIGFLRRRWDNLHVILTPTTRPKQPTEPTEPTESEETHEPTVPDEPDEQLSADELL